MALVFGLKYGVPMELCPLTEIGEDTELPQSIKKDGVEGEYSREEQWELLNGKKLRLEGER